MENISLGELVALVIMALLAGTAAANVYYRGRFARARRYSVVRNFVIGLIGAVVGIAIFRLLGLEDDIPEFLQGSISLADILIAFIGSLIVLFAVDAVA